MACVEINRLVKDVYYKVVRYRYLKCNYVGERYIIETELVSDPLVKSKFVVRGGYLFDYIKKLENITPFRIKMITAETGDNEIVINDESRWINLS